MASLRRQLHSDGWGIGSESFAERSLVAGSCGAASVNPDEEDSRDQIRCRKTSPQKNSRDNPNFNAKPVLKKTNLLFNPTNSKLSPLSSQVCAFLWQTCAKRRKKNKSARKKINQAGKKKQKRDKRPRIFHLNFLPRKPFKWSQCGSFFFFFLRYSLYPKTFGSRCQ